MSDGVNGFTYNLLNLPATVTGPNASTYAYDATGKKLTRVKGSVTTHYIDGIQYNGGAIDFIQTEEGIARPVSGVYNYEYTLKDHLGNARYSFNSAGTQIQADDYYPFGKTFNSYALGARNNYLYNSKELQDGLEQYDYGARFYDPAVGRWNVVDPLSETSRKYSPYAYGLNNPIRFIDPDGMETTNWYQSNATGTVKWFDGTGEQDGYVNKGAVARVESSGKNSGVINLNADGTATNAATGESATSSVSGKTRIVAKDNGDFSILNKINDFITGGSVSRMSAAMDTYDREGSQAYLYHMIGNAHTEEMFSFMSGERAFGARTRSQIDINDVIDNPSVLNGRSLNEVRGDLKIPEGWESGALKKGRSAGKGWTLRQLNSRGNNYTDLYIQYSPGTPRHWGGSPYWKFSSGKTGDLRFPAE